MEGSDLRSRDEFSYTDTVSGNGRAGTEYQYYQAGQ